MRRDKISGFTIGKLSGHHIEVVIINNWRPVTAALWRGRRFIWRIGR